VSAEVSLSETVVFELLDWPGAERLCEHLRQRGRIRICECEGAALVSVQLGPEENGLAVLLRAVKHWLGDSALGPIRFHLDGRSYVLESGTAIRPAAAA
jgi:hypothetical protein